MSEKPITIIAQNIKVRRKAQGLTIKELAHRANISFSSLSAIENARINNISLNKLMEIASALNTNCVSLYYPLASDLSSECFSVDDIEEDYADALVHADILKEYYPPAVRDHKISSMLELVLILPFIDIRSLYDIYYRIMGAAYNYEEYISSLFEIYWARVPDSTEKKVIQKELDRIRCVRNGEPYIAESLREENLEGYKALSELLLKKLDTASTLESLLTNGNLYFKSEI